MTHSKISLKSAHLYFENALVNQVFQNIEHAYIAYLQKQNRLLLTPVSSQWFVKMYESPQQLRLKSRNLKGDKTLAVRGILVDNDIDDSDRYLEFEWVEKTNLLKINL